MRGVKHVLPAMFGPVNLRQRIRSAQVWLLHAAMGSVVFIYFA
jgi:hypothetical protein